MFVSCRSAWKTANIELIFQEKDKGWTAVKTMKQFNVNSVLKRFDDFVLLTEN